MCWSTARRRTSSPPRSSCRRCRPLPLGSPPCAASSWPAARLMASSPSLRSSAHRTATSSTPIRTALAALLYTGGTTGRSKGVMLSHNAMSAAGVGGDVVGFDPGLSVSLLPLPLSHAYGLLVSTLSLHGPTPGTSVLMRWFDPAAWLVLAARASGPDRRRGAVDVADAAGTATGGLRPVRAATDGVRRGTAADTRPATRSAVGCRTLSWPRDTAARSRLP